MFNIRSVALVAALAGHARVAVDAAGCYASYSGSSYSVGDWVSATKTTTETTTESCALGSSGCSASGFKTTTTTTSETNNYQCTQAAWCSMSAYNPTGIYSGSAWTKEAAACTGSATPASAPVPDAWSIGGCPKPYAAGTDYDEYNFVSVVKSAYSMVYQCKPAPNNLFCGMPGYEPGTSIYWEQAWEEWGSCTGMMSPTSSPVYVELQDQLGCPGAFDGGVVYEEGDKVAKDGLVYQCKSYPNSGHCSQTGYEPGTSIGSVGSGAQVVEYWTQAWTVTGYCVGTITPTSSPSFDQLEDMGGCPDEWSTQRYEEGDRVSSGVYVYECKSWPQMAHCGQAGYEPGGTTGHPDAWKDAWTLKGFCNGSIGPTSSPSYDSLLVAACADDWSSGGNIKYEEGDMVSVSVSTLPIRKVTFKCKAWPFSGHCGQYSPTQFGGDQGWTFVGSCNGSIGPTSSPSFDALANVDKCPQDWSSSTTDYEAGDLVSKVVSTAPSRKILYKCRDWPNSGYCNQGSGFEPGTTYSNMAWILMGYCEGTFAPTASPAAYAGTCEYDQCRMTTTSETCITGSTGCSCSGTTCTKSVETNVCTSTAVVPWTNSFVYYAGDVVRVGLNRFKCGEWPSYLWCRMLAFKPELVPNTVWNLAWTTDGLCA